jgi:hypothetical protein
MIAFVDCALLTGVDVMMNRMISTRRHPPVIHNASQWVEPIALKLVSKWVPNEVQSSLLLPEIAMNAENVRPSRDPEDRVIEESCRTERKEKMMDKTIADSFPASDPPSSLPNPDEDSFGLGEEGLR